MKHNINELMRIHNATTKNTYATIDYCKANNIPIPTNRADRVTYLTSKATYALPANAHTNNGKPVNVLDTNGIKVIYLLGEKTWFDTQKELEEYKK